MAILTLLSDFGLKDPYVAEMKAVILSINPHAQIVDISHEIEKYNVAEGAFTLASAAPFFPNGVVHVAVVDPGVGTKRRPIIVKARRSYYVGPDNGLLMLAAQRDGLLHVNHILNQRYTLSAISRTFHGRDVFAPVAAHLAKGQNPSKFGPKIQDYVLPRFVQPRKEKNQLCGEVLHIDRFGNIISNISAQNLEKMDVTHGSLLLVKLNDTRHSFKLCSAYGEVRPGKPLAIIGGGNFLEISINRGNAARTLNVHVGDPLCIRM